VSTVNESFDRSEPELRALMNYRETATAAFTPPAVDHYPALARRRGRLTSTLAGVAALIIIGSGAATAVVMLADEPTPKPPVAGTPAPSPSPNAQPSSPAPATKPTTASAAASSTRSRGAAPTTQSIPATAMLQPDDIGTGYSSAATPDDWSIEIWKQRCPGYVFPSYPGTAPAVEDRRDRRIVGPGRSLVQRVDLADRAKASWSIQSSRDFVGECGSFASGGGRYTMGFVATGFAGPDSFLVRAHVTGGDADAVSHQAFARTGEAVTTIGFFGEFTVFEMEQIVAEATVRLCQVSSTC
jgi:hypothetical protein